MFSYRAAQSGLLAQFQKCVAALFIATALATGAAADPAPDVAQAIFQQVNDFRVQHGLPPLQMNDKLQRSAQAYAELLASQSPNTTDQAQAGAAVAGCPGPKIHCWDGSTPASRAQAAGFSCPQSVLENEAGSRGDAAFLLPAKAVEFAMTGDPQH